MSKLRPVYRELASIIQAMKNCAASGNDEWHDRHSATLSYMIGNCLPHGAGIDNGISITPADCTRAKLVMRLGYHHMNEGGYYDGWTEHTVTVTPSFDGIDIRISGRNRNDIKEYLADVLHEALAHEIDIRELAQRVAIVNGWEKVDTSTDQAAPAVHLYDVNGQYQFCRIISTDDEGKALVEFDDGAQLYVKLADVIPATGAEAGYARAVEWAADAKGGN